jgi:hypothetical protein
MESVLFLVIVAVAIVACIVYILTKNYDNPDLNNDGKVDLKDVEVAVNKVKEEVTAKVVEVKEEVTAKAVEVKNEVTAKAVEVKAKVVEKAKVVADVNKDGKVDLKDAGAAATKVKEEVKTQVSKVNKNLRKKKK